MGGGPNMMAMGGGNMNTMNTMNAMGQPMGMRLGGGNLNMNMMSNMNKSRSAPMGFGGMGSMGGGGANPNAMNSLNMGLGGMAMAPMASKPVGSPQKKMGSRGGVNTVTASKELFS